MSLFTTLQTTSYLPFMETSALYSSLSKGATLSTHVYYVPLLRVIPLEFQELWHQETTDSLGYNRAFFA